MIFNYFTEAGKNCTEEAIVCPQKQYFCVRCVRIGIGTSRAQSALL